MNVDEIKAKYLRNCDEAEERVRAGSRQLIESLSGQIETLAVRIAQARIRERFMTSASIAAERHNIAELEKLELRLVVERRVLAAVDAAIAAERAGLDAHVAACVQQHERTERARVEAEAREQAKARELERRRIEGVYERAGEVALRFSRRPHEMPEHVVEAMNECAASAHLSAHLRREAQDIVAAVLDARRGVGPTAS